MWTLFLEQLAPSQSGRLQVFCSLTSPETGGGTPALPRPVLPEEDRPYFGKALDYSAFGRRSA
jgi:hypothetical protein